MNCKTAPTGADGRHARVAVWVGLWGGPNSRKGLTDEKDAWLPQVGTVSHCQIDRKFPPAYIAFAQMFHEGGCNVADDNGCRPQTLGLAVQSGDLIDAEVEYTFPGTGIHAGEYKFNYFIADLTRNTQDSGSLYTAHAVLRSDVAYQGGAVVEDYNETGGLAEFGKPVTFSKVAVGGSSGFRNPAVYAWNMVVSGKQLARLGSFRRDSFTVTWERWS